MWPNHILISACFSLHASLVGAWYAFLRACINEVFLIKSNWFKSTFLWIDVSSIRFGGKIRLWVLSGNHVLFPKNYDIGKRQHLTRHPADQYLGEQRRSTVCIVACAPPTASVLFWRRRLGSYRSHLLLRRNSLNATHGTGTAMQLSKFWAFPLCFGLIAWFSSRLADRAGGKIELATDMIVF